MLVGYVTQIVRPWWLSDQGGCAVVKKYVKGHKVQKKVQKTKRKKAKIRKK